MVIRISILIDSSVLVSYANTKDHNHQTSLNIIDGILSEKYGKPIISDYIFDEVITLCLARIKSMEVTKNFGNYILHSQIVFIRIDEQIFNKSWEIFQKEGNLSFTDCTILVLLKVLGITYIATFDRNLAKAAISQEIKVIDK